MAAPSAFALGLDFGTASVRALIANVADGEPVASAVAEYPSGVDGVLGASTDPHVARQNPADYLSAMAAAVKSALQQAQAQPGFSAERIVGIGTDATGSTPIPVDARNTPLGLNAEFRDVLDAQAWLWKDHTAHAEAAEISQLARDRGEPYLSKCGGAYSSEWYWSKILRCLRSNPRVAAAAYAWLEQSDYIPAQLTGVSRPEDAPRNACAAGHKAMYHPDWGGLPSEAFLSAVHPGLALVRARYRAPAVAADQRAGLLCETAAERLGLPAGIPVAVGVIDAHAGAIGAGCAPDVLVKIIGTSTCDCAVVGADQPLVDIPGVCGIVPDSIIPGMYGIEAGQAAVGDIFNWFVSRIGPAALGGGVATHEALTHAAGDLLPGESGLLALDWHNGNRTILVDPRLTGLIVGLTLATTPPEIYRALIEATALGARRIIERLAEYGVEVRQVVACGGIAEKNPLLMQVYADVLDRPMCVPRAPNTCALGAAICGAVAGGAYATIPAAQAAMTGVAAHAWRPIAENVAIYERLYPLYLRLHDAFGMAGRAEPLHGVMKALIDERDAVRARRPSGP